MDPEIETIRAALALVHDRHPDLAIDGELQFDAALLPSVAASKAPGSTVDGVANTFTFPTLAAGNIGYKIAERLGGAIAIRPMLQRFAKPANDLARGSTAAHVDTAILNGCQCCARS